MSFNTESLKIYKFNIYKRSEEVGDVTRKPEDGVI